MDSRETAKLPRISAANKDSRETQRNRRGGVVDGDWNIG
jgi:hypothetical protein